MFKNKIIVNRSEIYLINSMGHIVIQNRLINIYKYINVKKPFSSLWDKYKTKLSMHLDNILYLIV